MTADVSYVTISVPVGDIDWRDTIERGVDEALASAPGYRVAWEWFDWSKIYANEKVVLQVPVQWDYQKENSQ